MTKEDKKLLLKDLCGRIPYGVIIEIPYVYAGKEKLQGIYGNYVSNESGDEVEIEKVKLYLRSMSSMTKEEKYEFDSFALCSDSWINIDWLNAHHFDYRGLIPKGLALEAPKDMYKI